MPLRLDNAKCVAHMPTAEQQQQTKKDFKPRFKVDPAASPMPETRQPERLAPRATSNRNGGRDHLGILGEIKSEYPGEIIGIRNHALLFAGRLNFIFGAALFSVAFFRHLPEMTQDANLLLMARRGALLCGALFALF